ncbi:polyprenyl synthetase family protein [Companilactobacillus alimentarius]|uniref:Polyprenyl synthetase n=1 Tax=Companilactobacillus alimentarius DSM 20249 TaxID=1423720 RepID=A0A2K9HP57_9LACO|nr:polyprenyl synthetase family protein [Companilactobacillus alimentarius]AUI72153.1 polyprenyl synthetase [Companilactobacillus alimentarius DSM 20249]KRK78111.1 polyprenyl synthetase [Companilactobacillus alimentarius DSM 20249]MDT6952694.1 polyprenyl synthetase family protein [Companilactobacillus alimentarius]GEO44932.1 geranylgeranyl pyrophosphate synthase [Companilactobacillus alimentarius]
MANSIWKNYPQLGEQLDLTTNFIHKMVKINNLEISSMIVNLTSEGKMLRPAFFLLFSEFGEDRPKDSELIPLAASLEILHVATLVHDDVIDDSPLRRSQPTIHTKYGRRNAIYAGDYLFTLYFELISKHLQSNTDILKNALSMKKILIGELDQMLIDFNVEATTEMYFKEISGKTAELFGLSAQMGAIVSGANQEVIERCKNIGHDIGMAFQIIDDILDFSSTSQTGKPVHEDLKNGVYSLPYILGLEDKNHHLIEILSKNHLTADDDQKATAIVVDNGYLNQAKDIAREFTDRAVIEIEKLPKKRSQEVLKNVVKRLINRIK